MWRVGTPIGHLNTRQALGECRCSNGHQGSRAHTNWPLYSLRCVLRGWLSVWYQSGLSWCKRSTSSSCHTTHFGLNGLRFLKSYHLNGPWKPIGSWDLADHMLSRQSAHRWRQGCQPYALATFYDPETLLSCYWYSFLLEAEQIPGPRIRSVRLNSTSNVLWVIIY
jgi:hypothetical protein